MSERLAHAALWVLIAGACNRSGRPAGDSSHEHVPDAATAVTDATARKHLSETLGLASRERDMLAPIIPGRITGAIPNQGEVVAFYAESREEVQVLANVEGPAIGRLVVDVLADDGLLVFVVNIPWRDTCITNVLRDIDFTRNQLVYTCVLARREPTEPVPDKDMGRPRDRKRNVTLRRCGAGIVTRHRIGNKVTVLASSTGGGLSPLDREPTPSLFSDAAAEGDFLALRRALAKWHAQAVGDDARTAQATKLLAPGDPITSYWAARYLASAARFDRLRSALLENGWQRGLDDYFVSAVYQAAGYCQSVEARAFLQDPGLYQRLIAPDENRQRVRWLAPLIARLLTADERQSILAQLSRGRLGGDSVLFAADVLLYAGQRAALDAVFEMIAQEHGRPNEGLLVRVREIVKPRELLGEFGPDRSRFYDRWSDDPSFVLSWWERNRQSVVWSDADGGFVQKSPTIESPE